MVLAARTSMINIHAMELSRDGVRETEEVEKSPTTTLSID